MRFKTGFFLGCAAGAWAASKASELKQGDHSQADWPRVASSRAEGVTAEARADRVRALSELARERFNGLLDTPIGGIARDRLVEMVSSSRGRGNGSDSADQHRRSASR
jgi:hypothetical protein